MQPHNRKFMTIGFISSLSIIIIVVASLIFMVIFSVSYSQHQADFIKSHFYSLTSTNAERIDNEIKKSEQNITLIKGYISILDSLEADKSLEYLKKVLAETIQFDRNQCNCYFAFEPEKSEKYFKKPGLILTVNKNFKQINTGMYGKPENSVAEVWTNPQYLNNPKEVWYHTPKKSKNFEITPIYFDENYMKVWMFTVTQGIYEDDHFQGMVGIDILLDGLLRYLENVEIGNTGGLVMVDNQTGKVITKAGRPELLNFIDARERFKYNLYKNKESENIWKPILTEDVKQATVKGVNQVNYFVSSKKLKKLPWTIIAFQSKHELQGPLKKSLWNFILAGLILLGFSIGLSWFTVKNLTTPINQLINAMKKVKDANITGISAPVGGTAETIVLGDIFNHMIQTISDAVREKESFYHHLEEMNKTLEQKVERRTCQLKDKNNELESAMEKLKETQEQLVVKEKLASLGSLTAGIAHEIKNPLNFVNNFAMLSEDLVQELRESLEQNREKLDEKTIEDIEEILGTLSQNVLKINEHGKRADSIVKNMLLHSRGKTGERQQTDLNAMLDEYVNLAYHGMRAIDSTFNITINKDYDQTIGKISLVPQDFGRVILNVVNNGFYAASEKKKNLGGNFSPEIKVSSKIIDDKIEIRIRDNGTGIPDKIKDKIFNPFFTTKPPGAGTGLGLSISYEVIVRGHNGEFSIDTREGEFTEFIIRIPKNQDKI